MFSGFLCATSAADRTDDAGLAHQHLDRPVTHHDPAAEGELGVHPPAAVGATGLGMNRGSDRSARHGGSPLGRGASAPLVVARLRHPDDAAGDLDRELLGGHHRDRREPSFGSLHPQQLHRPTEIASSVSNSAIRFFATTSSAFSTLDKPGTSTAVDPVLAPPGIDRLLTDPQIMRDLGDAATGLEQIQNLPPKLRRIPPCAHTAS